MSGFACRDVADLATDATEGALASELRAAFDAHVAHCAPCREHLRGLARVVAILGSVREPAPPVPEAVVDAFRQRFRRAR